MEALPLTAARLLTAASRPAGSRRSTGRCVGLQECGGVVPCGGGGGGGFGLALELVASGLEGKRDGGWGRLCVCEGGWKEMCVYGRGVVRVCEAVMLVFGIVWERKGSDCLCVDSGWWWVLPWGGATPRYRRGCCLAPAACGIAGSEPAAP